MSLAGFKKQINKANQYVSEKIGGAKGTELDDEFNGMEKRTDSLGRLIEELMINTQEMLQPNPATRVKMIAAKSISKLKGTTNHGLYPQPEGLLGECMSKYGKELGDGSLFGQGLVESGEAYKQLGEIKYSMEDMVKQNFLEPLQHLQNKDLKEVNFHRKKMHGRRLDFDCKKRKQGAGDDELRMAEEKFVESKELAETAMHNLLENDTELLLQLSSFIEADLNFHRQSTEILQSLLDTLNQRCEEASSRPKKEYIPKKMPQLDSYDMDKHGYNEARINKPTIQAPSRPHCEALYDFDAENEGELAFKEGDSIDLLGHIDENWLEGSVHGKTGYFPITYVKIIVDTPNH